MDLGLKGKVAVVTGGDSGIGKATAELLVREGAKVAVIDQTSDSLKQAVEEISKFGEAIAVQADLTQLEAVKAAQRQILEQFGTVHIGSCGWNYWGIRRFSGTDAMMEKRSQQMGSSFDEAIDSFLKENRPNLELKRRGKPEEVAVVIAFLCSERSSFVLGANYRVDGGSVAAI